MASDLVFAFPGQCRLQVDSTSQISLQRYQGAYIPVRISGTWGARLIQSSGPTLSNSGLTAATLYYVYAYDNSGTLTLEASTTGHATDTTNGVEVKSGDSTRTLVGMVYMDAGSPGTFVNSTAKRYCLNWFNRSGLELLGTFSSDRTVNTTSYSEINSEVRIQYLAWADEAVLVSATGTTSNDTNGQATFTTVALDSTSVETQASGTTDGINTRLPFSISVTKRLTEGFHYATLLGAVSGGIGTWSTATSLATGPTKTNLYGLTRG